MVPRLMIVLATHSVRERRREIGYHIRLWFSPSSAVLRNDGIFKRQFLFLFLVWVVNGQIYFAALCVCASLFQCQILPGPWQLLQIPATTYWSDYGLQNTG